MNKTNIIGQKEKYYSASQWTLVRGRFRKNRMASIGFWFLKGDFSQKLQMFFGGENKTKLLPLQIMAKQKRSAKER